MFGNVQLGQWMRKKRWNLQQSIEIKDGMLVCENEKHPINEICHYDGRSKDCTINGTSYGIAPV